MNKKIIALVLLVIACMPMQATETRVGAGAAGQAKSVVISKEQFATAVDRVIKDKNKALQENYILKAAQLGYLDLIKRLVKAGVDINTRTPKGNTVLMIATLHDQHEVENWVIGHDDCDVTLKNNAGEDALNIALKVAARKRRVQLNEAIEQQEIAADKKHKELLAELDQEKAAADKAAKAKAKRARQAANKKQKAEEAQLQEQEAQEKAAKVARRNTFLEKLTTQQDNKLRKQVLNQFNEYAHYAAEQEERLQQLEVAANTATEDAVEQALQQIQFEQEVREAALLAQQKARQAAYEQELDAVAQSTASQALVNSKKELAKDQFNEWLAITKQQFEQQSQKIEQDRAARRQLIQKKKATDRLFLEAVKGNLAAVQAAFATNEFSVATRSMDGCGDTLLHRVALWLNETNKVVYDYLVQQGSDVHLKNNEGKSALDYCQEHHNVLLVQRTQQQSIAMPHRPKQPEIIIQSPVAKPLSHYHKGVYSAPSRLEQAGVGSPIYIAPVSPVYYGSPMPQAISPVAMVPAGYALPSAGPGVVKVAPKPQTNKKQLTIKQQPSAQQQISPRVAFTLDQLDARISSALARYELGYLQNGTIATQQGKDTIVRDILHEQLAIAKDLGNKSLQDQCQDRLRAIDRDKDDEIQRLKEQVAQLQAAKAASPSVGGAH